MNVELAWGVVEAEINLLARPAHGLLRVLRFVYVGCPRIYGALFCAPKG